MKTILFSVLLVTICSTHAQKSGMIDYQITVNTHKFMTGEYEKYKEFVPEFKESNKLLFFNEEYALYENKPIEVTSAEQSGGGWGNYNPDNKRYTEVKTNALLLQLDMMGKKFLVSDSVETIKWKMTGKSKMIDNRPCISAEYSDTMSTYTAWFTPTIPVQLGPEHYGQLPGMILEVTNADTSVHIKAIDIQLRDLEEDEIKKPKKGKEMTRAEFDAMIEEKMKQFGKEGAKGMRMMMH